MEFDKELAQKISKINDDELKSSIENVAKAMGADVKGLEFYLRDMEKIKKTLSGLTQSDFDKITSAIGEDKARDIIENIKKEVE